MDHKSPCSNSGAWCITGGGESCSQWQLGSREESSDRFSSKHLLYLGVGVLFFITGGNRLGKTLPTNYGSTSALSYSSKVTGPEGHWNEKNKALYLLAML